MGHKLLVLGIAATVIGLVTPSCSSSDGDTNPGSAGAAAGSGGESLAGASGDATTSAGTAGDLASGGADSAAGAAGQSEAAGAGGAFISVAEATCVENSDCLPVCQHYGWPKAHCFGYCYCESDNGVPSCTPGTTEGCPANTKCRGGSGCLPYGTGTDDVPCTGPNECAVGYECIKYGNPLPNGNNSACRHICDNAHPLPADCESCENNDFCDPHPASAGAGPN